VEQAERVGTVRVDRIKEIGVLGVGDFGLADAVGVGDAAITITVNVVGVARIADGGSVECDVGGLGVRHAEKCES